MAFDVPVAFFIYNRPEPTARVFEQIALLRPRRLLIVADGPREGSTDVVPPAARGVFAARQVVAHIDWPCDVRRNYAERNLGCRRRMSSGIDWVFSQCEEAILLEDDCLPEPTFFPYCAELLDRYRADERVMVISGDNMQLGHRCTADSYYFSAIPHIWGWASWRRAWRHYDVTMADWPNVSRTAFPGNWVGSPVAAAAHRRLMADVFAGKVDTWDTQWEYACWKRRGLSILPAVNLISNIGFGPSATHCRKPDRFAALPTEAIAFPLKHPGKVELLEEADLRFFGLAHAA